MTLDPVAFEKAVVDGWEASPASAGLDGALAAAITVYNREVLAPVMAIIERWEHNDLHLIVLDQNSDRRVVEAIRKLIE